MIKTSPRLRLNPRTIQAAKVIREATRAPSNEAAMLLAAQYILQSIEAAKEDPAAELIVIEPRGKRPSQGIRHKLSYDSATYGKIEMMPAFADPDATAHGGSSAGADVMFLHEESDHLRAYAEWFRIILGTPSEEAALHIATDIVARAFTLSKTIPDAMLVVKRGTKYTVLTQAGRDAGVLQKKFGPRASHQSQSRG